MDIKSTKVSVTDILNRLFALNAENRIKAMVIGVINNDGSHEVMWHGKAHHLEKVGLVTNMQFDIMFMPSIKSLNKKDEGENYSGD